MSDIIRIIKSQKDCIEKLIPDLLKEYNEMKPTGIPALDMLKEDHIKAIEKRDYSVILSILITKSAKEMGVDLLKNN